MEVDMIVIMDMNTGKIISEQSDEPEFGSHADQVLNAEWLRPELQLGLQPVVHHDASPAEAEAEAFLANLYRCQE
jgi:hypothetical protein